MAKSYEKMITEAKEATRQVSVEEVRKALDSGESVTVVDVREPDEWEEGHIAGAKLVPRGLLELQAADQLSDKDAEIVVHCALGGRGSLAAKSLQEMGYTNVDNMEGGVNAWRERDYDTE